MNKLDSNSISTNDEADSQKIMKTEIPSLIEEFITSKDARGLMNYLHDNCNEYKTSSIFDQIFSISKDFYSKICEEGILLDNAVAHHKYALSLILISNNHKSEIERKKIYDDAKLHLEKSIKQGFILSYFVYARLQYEIFNNNDEAFQAVEEGAKRGEKYSKCLFGFFIAHGIGTNKDFNKGVSIMLESKAENFYEMFSTDFGIYYSNIEGEESKAFYWFEKAFNMKHTKATINNYGICFMIGFGVSKNIDKAKQIFQLGVNMNDMNSMYHLRFILEETDRNLYPNRCVGFFKK